MRAPAPRMLPCGHFSQDGSEHCRICAEKAVTENLRIRAELDAAAPSRPDPYGCDRHPKGEACRCYWGD